MNETKRYTVSILGESYTLLSDDTEEHILQTARMVNSLLKDILEKTSVTDTKRAAVLVAFRFASKLIRVETNKAEQEGMCNKLIDLIDEKSEMLD